MFIAFIQANKLYRKTDGSCEPMTREELERVRRILGMAEAMGESRVTRAKYSLTDGK